MSQTSQRTMPDAHTLIISLPLEHKSAKWWDNSLSVITNLTSGNTKIDKFILGSNHKLPDLRSCYYSIARNSTDTDVVTVTS
jgi:hypothetical protein